MKWMKLLLINKHTS